MLAAVKGYYNGSHIVMNEDISLNTGQEVIVTILDTPDVPDKKIDLKTSNNDYLCLNLLTV